MKRLQSIINSEGLKSSVVITISNIFAQGLSGVAIILLSRSMGVSQFGIFSTGFSIALIAASLIDIGLIVAQQQAIPRAKTVGEKNKIFSTALSLKFILFVVTAVVAIPFSPMISARLHVSPALLIFWILLANIGSVFFNQFAGMLFSVRRIAQAATINIAQAFSKFVFALILIFITWESGAGILIIYLTLPLLILPFSGLLLPKWYRFSATFDGHSWLTMKSMALNNWVASFGLVLIQNADMVLVGMLLSQNEVGLMGIASRFALFIALIGGSLASVLIPRVSTYRLQTDLDSFWRKALLILLGSIGLAVVSFVISAPTIIYTVGEKYLEAAPVLALLMSASWLAVGVTPINSLFYSYDKAWFFSISAVSQVALLLIGNIVLLPIFGIIAAGWVRLFVQILIVCFSLVVALFSHYQRFQQMPSFLSRHG